jgi:hypothetical protein
MVVVRRAVQILLLAVLVGLLWRWIGQTTWASLVDVGSAGEQFTSPIEPLRMVTGALLVAVPAVLLIRAAWSWLEQHVLGREHTDRIPDEVRSSGRR